MMNKEMETKVARLLKEERIALETETDRFKYFLCRGYKDTYEIIYNKVTETYSCTCKNVKDKECSHILACQKYKEEAE